MEMNAKGTLRAAGYRGPTVAASTPIAIGPGRTAEAVEAALKLLRERPDVFDLGGAMVQVHNGATVPLDRHALAHFLGTVARFARFKADGTATWDDPPQRLVDQLLSLGAMRGLKPLDAVTTIPTLRPDGTVLDTPGYDSGSRLLYVGDNVTVPEHPTPDEVKAAYGTILFPFREFPFVGPTDWAVLLAAIITAVVRPALPTAPAFAFDAPTVGSGKTLLASCIAAIASGERPEPWPPVQARDDEEIRKRLFAALRTAMRAIVWDNLTGTLDSPSLAAFLTGPTFRDRILGKSESLALPNRAVFLLTGNNITLAGDMPRRVLPCRIDPRVERAFARQFDLDPLAHVMAHRTEMATAALTIVRGWLTSGAAPRPGRVASFEQWDSFVRQPVAWLTGVDPLDAISAGADADPERESLGDLLAALRACFGDGGFTAADVTEAIRKGAGPFGDEAQRAVATAIADVAGRNDPSAKSIGRIFNFRRGRIVNGMRLECRQERNVKQWFVGLASV
jgi:hypothetical protein